MRALVVRPPSAGVRLAEVEEPELAPGQVGVRVLEGGICGTDRDIAEGRYGRPPAGRTELILGHENLGEVVGVGTGVTDWSAGQLVVATVRRGCGSCRFCRSNRSDFCETGRYTERGISGQDGYFCDRYAEAPEYLVHVPPDLRGIAVLLEPLSVVEKALDEGRTVLDRREPTAEPPESPPSALVTGTGAIGMLSAFRLRADGFEVTAIDRHAGPSAATDVLRAIGVRHVDVADGLGPLGSAQFDLIVEASGSALLDFDLLRVLGPNGTLILTGIPPSDTPAFPVPGGALLRGVVLRNQAIVGSVNANRTYFEQGVRDLVRFRQRFGTAVDRLLTERHPVEEFADVLGPREHGAIKTVLTLGH